jgi:hypothetical protein
LTPTFYNIPLSFISQSDINASNARSKAHTELINYWKRNLEGKIGRQQGRQSHDSNESAYTFSGEKNKSYHGNTSPSGPSHSYGGSNNSRRNSKVYVNIMVNKGIRQ